MEMHDAGPPDAGAHQDHNSKHGGTFFMALDNKHHIEGLLESPGVFEVYLYDDHTRPVSRRELNQARMTVIWGEQDGAPKIDLKPRSDGTLLEARAPGAMHFPVTLTLLVHFPGSAASAKPELFTFPFQRIFSPSEVGDARPSRRPLSGKEPHRAPGKLVKIRYLRACRVAVQCPLMKWAATKWATTGIE